MARKLTPEDARRKAAKWLEDHSSAKVKPEPTPAEIKSHVTLFRGELTAILVEQTDKIRQELKGLSGEGYLKTCSNFIKFIVPSLSASLTQEFVQPPDSTIHVNIEGGGGDPQDYDPDVTESIDIKPMTRSNEI